MRMGLVRLVIAAAVIGIGTTVWARAAAAQPDPAVIHACAKLANGQLRIAESGGGCLPSEVPVAWNIEGQPGADASHDPIERNRTLTIGPESDGQFNGIFGGLLCPAGRAQVSGGFKLLRNDIEIRESFIGEGFGLPRVYIVLVLSKTLGALPAGDMVQMFTTCL